LSTPVGQWETTGWCFFNWPFVMKMANYPTDATNDQIKLRFSFRRVRKLKNNNSVQGGLTYFQVATDLWQRNSAVLHLLRDRIKGQRVPFVYPETTLNVIQLYSKYRL
jgi:hypothetical protein